AGQARPRTLGNGYQGGGQPRPGSRPQVYHRRQFHPRGDLMDGAAGGGRAVAQQLTIVNRKGLHARASARFVRTAECFDATLSVIKAGTSVNGNSIMGLMMLGAGPGSTILVQASGKQAREALEAIVELVNNGFDEDVEGTAE